MRLPVLIVAFAAALCLALPAAALINGLGSGTAVTCGTTATPARDTSVPFETRRLVTLCVPTSSARAVKIGGPGVTYAKGITVEPGQCRGVGDWLAPSVALYCIATAATAVEVIEAQ